MSNDERVRILEEEFKLIKNEIRQTLSSVRDFMLDLKLPPMPEEPVSPPKQQQAPAAAGPGSGPDSSRAKQQGTEPETRPFEALPHDEDACRNKYPAPESEFSSPYGAVNKVLPGEGQKLPISDFKSPLNTGPGNAGIGRNDLFMEDRPDSSSGLRWNSKEKTDETRPAVSQANLLANLIRWAARAKREIGNAQLPVFLDVYSTTGNLSIEMRQIILHLAEVATDMESDSTAPGQRDRFNEEISICMELLGLAGQLPEEINVKVHRLTELVLKRSIGTGKADIWSQLLLELHGILAEGSRSLRSLGEIAENETGENRPEDKVREKGSENKADPADEKTRKTDPHLESPVGETKQEVPGILNGARPAKLRLVMPVEGGMEQELDLGSFFIDTELKTKKR